MACKARSGVRLLVCISAFVQMIVGLLVVLCGVCGCVGNSVSVSSSAVLKYVGVCSMCIFECIVR
jgi:hypothetical protein